MRVAIDDQRAIGCGRQVLDRTIDGYLDAGGRNVLPVEALQLLVIAIGELRLVLCKVRRHLEATWKLQPMPMP
ncbi:hypothetical protein A0U93_11675 [Neoasaia chiangmaiensis]|uniref:Uncharacterized protein n=1 Tax=Neoasaia chiangmaiensis TaxID=320497 RepID=A0A1U9KRJ4_9PROT|nr:hypothetical protein A0U93_11675 [Neoasaia chiangmaiensis]